MRFATTVLGFVIAMLAAGTGYGQAVRSGFSGGALPKQDDVASSKQALGFTVNFFGTNFDGVYVTDNGYVTFDGQKTDFTPEGLKNNQTKIIAPNKSPLTNNTVTGSSPAMTTAWGIGLMHPNTKSAIDATPPSKRSTASPPPSSQ